MALLARTNQAVTGRTLIWGAVLAAWALAFLLPVVGQEAALSHDAILEERRLPWPLALLFFVAAWQVMTGAMMLPSSLPLIRLFARMGHGEVKPRQAIAVFLAAYFAVWTGFALLALTSIAGLHALIARWSWLEERPHVISGSILLLSGAFQFSPLKERCLDACRSPLQFLWRFYKRGLRSAWTLGLRHGLFCLGCCWALMMVMFAVGATNLVWMAGLTGVMVIEKSAPRGRRLAPLVGGTLLVWGALVLLRPEWLPPPLRGL